MNRKIYKHKDNVRCQLNAGISASATTIPLKSGNGAQLPTTYGGTASSLGSGTLLNSTGIGASGVAVGDIIENVTDGSYAVITAVSTNSVATTRLKGGSDNTWQNADKWAVNRFIITLINYDTNGETILKREKVLIDSRTGDNLTVNASGRGFDGDTAQTFSADDYVFLFLTSAATDGIGQGMSQIIQDVDRLISQGSGEVYAADGGGTDAYAITLVPAISAYAVGQVFNFKANTANVGAASLNVNGLGAITIKKNHDLDLEDGDIESGQIVTVAYDGTYFQMQSQIANLFASKANVQKGELIYAADAGASDAYAITLSPAPAAYTTGMMIHFKANTVNTGAATLNVNSLGAKTIKKNYDSDLIDGDIKAGQLVSVIYDGTNFQLLSSPNNSKILSTYQMLNRITTYYPGAVTLATDGTVMFIGVTADSTAKNYVRIFRLAKDSVTGLWYITHQASYNPGNSNGNYTMAVVGNYLFVARNQAATIVRFDKADLTNQTSMTVSGGSMYAYSKVLFSDPSDANSLYVWSLTTGYRLEKYSISGTTLTYVSYVSTSTGLGTDGGGAGTWADATYFYVSDAGNNNIKRITRATGAETTFTCPDPVYFLNNTNLYYTYASIRVGSEIVTVSLNTGAYSDTNYIFIITLRSSANY